MIRNDIFSSNVLAEKKKRSIGETRRQKICKQYVKTLAEKGVFYYIAIEGPIRYAQGNKNLLESTEPQSHTFRLLILSELLVSLFYFIPIYKGYGISEFKRDVLADSLYIFLEKTETDIDIAFGNILKVGFEFISYDCMVRNVAIINHCIAKLATANWSDQKELERGVNTIMRHLESKCK